MDQRQRRLAGRAAPGARPAGRAAAGGRPAGRRAALWPDEVRIAGRAAQPRRGVLPPAARPQHAGDGDGGPRRGARDRRRPRQDAEPGHRLRRHARSASSTRSARSRRSGSRSATGWPRLVSLTLTPLAITDGLAALGRPLRAGAGRRLTRSSSAARSPRCCPTTCPRARARGHGRLRRPGADRPRGRGYVARGAHRRSP